MTASTDPLYDVIVIGAGQAGRGPWSGGKMSEPS
jgi:cation diffusion facilitator CzcD-associated flavoprotein CzcO